MWIGGPMTTKRNVLGLAIGAALIIVFFMTPAFPQGTETGGITGVVKDPQGATVPGAKVEIYNERTGTLERGLTTQSDGTYTATLLRPGSYRVEITAASFKRYRAVSVQVRITERARSYTITTNTKANEPLRHQILGLSRTKGARVTDNIGQATYHSGQVTLSRRFHGGLFFQSAYTYSKSIDNVSGSLSTDELNATRAG